MSSLEHASSHAEPGVETSDERHLLGDIIAHLLIGSWMLLMAISIISRSSKTKIFFRSWRSSRYSVLLPAISGISFWTFLTFYQLSIMAVRRLAKPTWVDHLKMTFVLSCAFLIQYAHVKKYLRESFWIVAEPLSLCAIATMFGFMHSQHEQSGAAYHRLGAYVYILLAAVRFAEFWYSAVAVAKTVRRRACTHSFPYLLFIHRVNVRERDHPDLNPIFTTTETRKTPLPFLSAFLYALGGIWMMDIAITPYIRPQIVATYTTDEALMSFCAERMVFFVLSLFFLFAMLMVCLRMFETMYKRTALSVALRTPEDVARDQLLHEL